MGVIVMRLMLLASLCGAAPVNKSSEMNIDSGYTEEDIDNEGDRVHDHAGNNTVQNNTRDNKAFYMQFGDLTNSPINMNFGDFMVNGHHGDQGGHTHTDQGRHTHTNQGGHTHTNQDHVQDGGWSVYGPCNKICGGGMKKRSCTNPAPVGGGKLCIGSAAVQCNSQPCAGVSNQEAIKILQTLIQDIEDGLRQLEKKSRSKRDLDKYSHTHEHHGHEHAHEHENGYNEGHEHNFSDDEWKLLEIITEAAKYIQNDCSTRQSQCQLGTMEALADLLTTTFNKIISTGKCSPGFVGHVGGSRKTFDSVAAVAEQAQTGHLKKEGEECGPCNCPPTYTAGNCENGLDCVRDPTNLGKPGYCLRPPTGDLKKEGEACGTCNCPPSYTAGNCENGLDCVRDSANPDKPGYCHRPHTERNDHHMHAAQDGGWSAYGPCSTNCGGGIKTRTCSNPAPLYGGLDCTGTATIVCNAQPCQNFLLQDDRLEAGDLLSSSNGLFKLHMQLDGNCVLSSQAGVAMWSTNTAGAGSYFTLQEDGDLVCFNKENVVVWSSGTGGLGADRLILENEGILVLYRSNGQIVWVSSKTCTSNAVNTDACFCKNSTGGMACTSGHGCNADGICQSVCTDNAINLAACFCKSSTGGKSCNDGQRCTAGTCQPVCAVDAVNLGNTCFCGNGQEGEACTTGKRCSSDGTCLNDCLVGVETSSDCFCKFPTGGSGSVCTANKVCIQNGNCLDVCAVDAVNLGNTCFCGNGQGGEACNNGNGCSSDGTCLNDVVLLPNAKMEAGDLLSSLNGLYQLHMQPDGNCVLSSEAGVVVWSTNTAGAGSYFTFQGNGDLVCYNKENVPVWNSGTGGLGADRLLIQNDGILALYGSNGQIVWMSSQVCSPDEVNSVACFCASSGGESCSAGHRCNADGTCQFVCLVGVETSSDCFCKFPTGDSGSVCTANKVCAQNGNCLDVCAVDAVNLGNTCFCGNEQGGEACTNGKGCSSDGTCLNDVVLLPNAQMEAGDLLSSLNGLYQLHMQPDGNCVLSSEAGVVMWSTNTAGAGSYFTFRRNGDLVCYNKDNVPVWNSGTGRLGADRLLIQNDGILALYGSNGRIVWRSSQICSPDEVNSAACLCASSGGESCSAGHRCNADRTCQFVCAVDAVNLGNTCFCGNGQGGEACTNGKGCSSSGTCLNVCTANAINLAACFCKSSTGGESCRDGQRCTAGTCQPVCAVDAVNLGNTCFCGNEQGGEVCTNGKHCSSDRTCLNVCTPGAVDEGPCFCASDNGGEDCNAQQKCNTDGTCQEVCIAGAVNEGACFCASVNGGYDCDAGQKCNTDGTCQDVCKYDSDCPGYDINCLLASSDPSCEYCTTGGLNNNGLEEGVCMPGCNKVKDKCPDEYECKENHECLPSCAYPCCKTSLDCTHYETPCGTSTPPSCEFCTAMDQGGTDKGECKPGCDVEHNKCPQDHVCLSNHICFPFISGKNTIKKILVTTKECVGCSSDEANEGGAVIKVIGSNQCQVNDPPCVCDTNGLDHPETLDYEAGKTIEFESGKDEDLSTMGGCYQIIMMTRRVTISWDGPDGSTWSPESVIIVGNGGYKRTCTPEVVLQLTNQDAPVEVKCEED